MNKETINKIEIDESSMNSQEEELSKSLNDQYAFGWSKYAETTNGRFAMLGLLAILIIETISKQSFLHWAGILH